MAARELATCGQAGDTIGSARSVRRAHSSASGWRVRIRGGRRSRIRPWRGSGHARPVARGGAYAVADPGHATDNGGREVLCEGIFRILIRPSSKGRLQDLTDDLTVAEFLRRHFAGPEYDRLRRSIERMVEGYDAADPERASTLALRDEWMVGGHHTQGRIIGGYGALIEFLAAECRDRGVAIRLGAAVSAIEEINGSALVRCANGDAHECDAVILTVPLPLLNEIVLPAAERERAAAAAHIGFGNVIKILLRFETAGGSTGERISSI